jgi:peroxiredoxin
MKSSDPGTLPITKFPRATLIVAALAALTTACAAQHGTASSAGQQRNDFALRDTSGRTVRLSDYLGRNVVLINFWATWCTPCSAELPHLNRMYEQHKAEGLVVLGIAMDGPETVANVGAVARRYNLNFPVLLDDETRVVGVYNPKRTAPFSVLIGRDSHIAKTREGYVPGDEVAIESDILSLLHKTER